MFSKFYVRIILAAVMVVSMGCGLKFGEESKDNFVAEIKGADCLTASTENLKLFINGDATDDQVGSAAECLQKVVITFKDNIRGKDKNSYTPEELFGFVQKQFLKNSDSRFTPELISQIMKFKVLLFGGSETVILKTEIEAISSFIARFKPELVRLNPHMKIIVSKWDLSHEADLASKEQKFQAAKTAFNALIMKFSDFVLEGGRTYKINDLITLLQEFSKFTNSTSDVITKIDNLKLFILKSKMILCGGDETLKGAEWTAFHHTLSELYIQTLRVQYFITPVKPENSEEKLYGVQKIGEDISQLVVDLLEGRGAKEVTNAQIGELIEAAKPLAPDLIISPELINQIGKLKMVLLGKHENGFASWSVLEFQMLNKALPWLFGQAQILTKNFKQMKVNKMGFRKNEIKLEDFLVAEKAVLASVKEISGQLKYAYDLADLRLLVLNAKPLLKDVTYPENLEEVFMLVATAKYALTGEPGTPLSVANLQLLMNVVINAYGNSVQYSNFVSPFKPEEAEFVTQLEPVLMKSHNTLLMELNLKPSHVLLTQELTPLVLMAQVAKVITTDFEKDSLDKGFDELWSNIFNTPLTRIEKGTKLPGFNEEALKNLTEEVLYWVEAQKNISEIFAKKAEYTKEDLKSELLSRLGAAKSPIAAESLRELARLLNAPGMMNFNDRGYLKILTETLPVNGLYHVDDLINSNLSRALARLLIRTLVMDKDRMLNITGMTLDELRAGFDQLKYLGYDMELLDPKNPDFIGGRFREASLFLAPSNGDEYASFEETHHLVLHILSGISRADRLEKSQMAKCVRTSNLESIALTEFDTECLLNLYLTETEPFDELPQFIKLRTDRNTDGSPRYSPEKNKKYYCALLKAAGHIPTKKHTVLLRDAKLFPHVVQYIEMIFSTHDANHDGLLQMEEGLHAFPIFKTLIAGLVKPYPIVKEDDLPGVFIYLLKNGKPPEKNQLFTFAQFVKDHKCTNDDGTPKACHKGWDIQSTRHDLGSIFNFIADATAPKPPAELGVANEPTGDPCESLPPPPPTPTPPEAPSIPSNP